MPKEIAIFIEYEKVKDEAVAKFNDGITREFFSLTKEECEKRLENALKKGHLHDQTLAALRGWPKK